MRWCLFAFIADYIKPRQSIIALSLPSDHKRKSFLTMIWAILLRRFDFCQLISLRLGGILDTNQTFVCFFPPRTLSPAVSRGLTKGCQLNWRVFLIRCNRSRLVPAFKSNTDQNWENSLTIERLLPNTLEKVTLSQPLWINAMERNRVKLVL